MRAIQIERPGRVSVVERPVPQPEENENTCSHQKCEDTVTLEGIDKGPSELRKKSFGSFDTTDVLGQDHLFIFGFFQRKGWSP